MTKIIFFKCVPKSVTSSPNPYANHNSRGLLHHSLTFPHREEDNMLAVQEACVLVWCRNVITHTPNPSRTELYAQPLS